MRKARRQSALLSCVLATCYTARQQLYALPHVVAEHISLPKMMGGNCEGVYTACYAHSSEASSTFVSSSDRCSCFRRLDLRADSRFDSILRAACRVCRSPGGETFVLHENSDGDIDLEMTNVLHRASAQQGRSSSGLGAVFSAQLDT